MKLPFKRLFQFFKALAQPKKQVADPSTLEPRAVALAVTCANCWPNNQGPETLHVVLMHFADPQNGRKNMTIYASSALSKVWDDYCDMEHNDDVRDRTCLQIADIERQCRALRVPINYPKDFEYPDEFEQCVYRAQRYEM
ncbi:MAG: hypothetical protein KGQ41_06400 [Alphaproteobacteria bacterium]|nr:hypothetical protein [Alphaproteobacteria bacterium]